MKKSISFVMVNGILAAHVTKTYTDGSQFEMIVDRKTGDIIDTNWVKPIRAIKPDEILVVKNLN